MRHLGFGIALIVCAAAVGCVTYGYQPIGYQGNPVQPVTSEPIATEDGRDQPFYDDLTPYGRWVYTTGPGWVWSPDNMQADWRPYQAGHWVFTDYGWTWASDEPWGWAVYHYGRWNQDPRYGWVWVPGTEWGPAWVAWHEGGGYVGWAPLPSQVRVQVGVGLDWGGVNISLQPSSWCFVSARNLVDPGLRNRIEPPSRNVTLIQVTRNVTNYTYIDNRVVNQGVRVDSIGRALGHAVPHYRIAEAESTETVRGGKVRGQDFVVFRPDPRRGHESHGRSDPPGHGPRQHARDFRGLPSQGDPGSPEPPSEEARPASAPQPSTPSQPPATAAAQEKENHGHSSHQSRGRSFFDRLKGRPAPRPSGQGSAPSQPAPPAQSASVPVQSPNAPPPPAGAAVAPPSSNAPPAKGQPPKFNGRGPRNPPPKRDKPKAEASKPKDSDPDKSKQEGAGSDH